MPLVAFLESAGARLQEGARRSAASAASSRPTSPCAAASRRSRSSRARRRRRLLLARAHRLRGDDRGASMFLTGPADRARGRRRGHHRRAGSGGPVHERNGVCHFVADRDLDASSSLTRELLGYLPQTRTAAAAPRRRARPRRDPGAFVPREPRSAYDVRDVDRAASSTPARSSSVGRAGRATWSSPSRASRARRSASSPTSRATSAASSTSRPRRRARASCAPATRFGLRCWCSSTRRASCPARAGVGRRDPPRRRAAARVRRGDVPRVTVILRKAYGGAYITMNSKDLGADVAFAWRTPRSGS